MSSGQRITKKEFASLSPYQRGYTVYWCGANPKQPNVPDEENPYPVNSLERAEWDQGAEAAARDAQDGDD